MKDDQTARVLLEGLSADVAAVLKIVSHQNGNKNEPSTKSEIDQCIKPLSEKVEKINELLKRIESNKLNEADQRRYINLNILLERIWKRINPGDNLFLHYFTPMKICINTLLSILLFFMLGAVADQLYMKYRANKNQIINTQPTDQ